MGYPLSFAALSSSPKGAPLDYAGNFIATVEAVPLGKVDCRKAARRRDCFSAEVKLCSPVLHFSLDATGAREKLTKEKRRKRISLSAESDRRRRRLTLAF